MGYAWNDSSYYGKRTKRYYKFLDTLLKKLFKQAAEQTPLDAELLDQIIKLTGRQNDFTRTIMKLVETMDIIQRLTDLEKKVQLISPGSGAHTSEFNTAKWR